MIITVDSMILSIKGNMSNYYIRKLNGQLIMQRRPVNHSEKQRACQKEFAQKYAGKKH